MNDIIPEMDQCFCGKSECPKYAPYLLPHSCGQPCMKQRGCVHLCNIPCHPGPCPPCEANAPSMQCHCGKTNFIVRCSELSNTDFNASCGESCGRRLKCSKHVCEKKCHEGPCDPCQETVLISCQCGKSTRKLACDENTHESFQCTFICGFKFDCGLHQCTLPCHSSEFHSKKCAQDPSLITHCPCGSKLISTKRTQCSDPIPCCSSTCNKKLPCGHRCQQICHAGPW
jgi:hypothetical protein